MMREAGFRKILPLTQTFVAAVFGGWGLFIRDSIIRNSLGWNSTLRFHVWPWPFKFAAILNMPAFIAGLLVSWPLDSLRPGLPESVSMLPTLLFVTWLWYPIGSWADRTSMSTQSKNARLAFSISFLLFTLVCATAASISAYIGSYTSYLVIGTAIWLTVTIGVNVYPAFRKRIAKGRLSPG
jgi:hypothetical protein